MIFFAFCKIRPNNISMHIVLTGASSGIGLSLAKLFHQRGFDQTFLVRSQNDDLKSLGRCINVDLSDIDQIKKAVKSIKKVDRLVHNAGVLMKKAEPSAQGFEKTMAVNVVAGHVLSNLLLKEMNPGHITIIGSEAHRAASKFFDPNMALRDPEARGWASYAKSKVMVNAWMVKWNEIHNNACIIHPGFVKTNLSRDLSGFMKFIWNNFSLSPEKSASNIIEIIVDAKVGYFDQGKPKMMSSLSNNKEFQEKLWTTLEEIKYK